MGLTSDRYYVVLHQVVDPLLGPPVHPQGAYRGIWGDTLPGGCHKGVRNDPILATRRNGGVDIRHVGIVVTTLVDNVDLCHVVLTTPCRYVHIRGLSLWPLLCPPKGDTGGPGGDGGLCAHPTYAQPLVMPPHPVSYVVTVVHTYAITLSTPICTLR